MCILFLAEKHIMLSYNHEAQNEVLKMNTMLKNLGYKVWVDVEKITEGKPDCWHFYF